MNWIELLASHETLIVVVVALTAALVAVLAIWIWALSRYDPRDEHLRNGSHASGRVKRGRARP